MPNEKNPRVISDKQFDDLKRSLKKFNVVEIPVIDTENRVIAGHQRLKVLQLLGRGEEEIDVRIPNRKLTKNEYDQYLLSSNRIKGDWDWGKLAEGFDIETILVSGFDDADLSHLFDEMAIEDDVFDIEKELVKIKDPKAKPGDIYQLETSEEITARYAHIEQSYTLSLDYVAIMIELFCKNEKINPGAYMFKNLLLTLRDYIDGNKHYTEVLQSAMPGYGR